MHPKPNFSTSVLAMKSTLKVAKLNEDLKRKKVKLAREKKMLKTKENELLEAREKLKRKRSVGDGSGAGS